MNNFYLKIQETLELKSEVIDLKPLSSNWYVIVRKGRESNRRYNLGVQKEGFNYLVLLWDYKTGIAKKFTWEDKLNLNLLSKEDRKNKPVNPVLSIYKILYGDIRF